MAGGLLPGEPLPDELKKADGAQAVARSSGSKLMKDQRLILSRLSARELTGKTIGTAFFDSALKGGAPMHA